MGKSNSIRICAICICLAACLQLTTLASAYGNKEPCLVFEESKILAADGVEDDYFGFSVDSDGSSLVVGAYGYDCNGIAQSGAVFVYRVANRIPVFEQKLLASSAGANHLFGYSVAIDGDVIVVGAFRNGEVAQNSGAAYVFRRNGTTWIEEQTLTASDGAMNDELGTAIAVNGDTIVVCSLRHGSGQGAAYVYRHTGAEWAEQGKLQADNPTADDRFGSSAAVVGTTIAIGADLDDSNGLDAGAVYVYNEQDDGWDLIQKLIATAGGSGDIFGHAIAISGDRMLVGAYRDQVNGVDSGTAYTFLKTEQWDFEAKLIPSDGAVGANFGFDVDLFDDVAAITALRTDNDSDFNRGSVYIYHLVESVWTERSQLIASDWIVWGFGKSVALGSSDSCVVGAVYDDQLGPSSGSAYVFNDVEPVPACACLADVDGDGSAVDVFDLLQVLASWGQCPEPCRPYCAADIDHSCAVDVLDLLEVLASWGQCS